MAQAMQRVKVTEVNVNNNLNNKPKKLKDLVANEIIGQPGALDLIIPYIQMYNTGLAPEGRPVGVFLLIGPTGTGKTRTIEVLAKALHGNEKLLLKVSCGEFQMEHEVAKLIGCFVEETRVLMADGSKKPIELIQPGELVISGNGNVKKVLDKYIYNHAGNLIELGREGTALSVCSTPQHEIYYKPGYNKRPTTKQGREKENRFLGEFKYGRADEIKKGDIVCHPRMKIDNKEQINSFVLNFHNISPNNLARLGGYYVSEGGKNSAYKGLNFTFALHEEDLVNEIKEFFTNLGVNTNLQRRKSSLRLYVYSTVICKQFCNWFGDRVDRKKIPSWLMNAPDDVVWNFLDAAFLGDGGKTVPRRLDYSTVSETLAWQMQTLINRLGFICQTQYNVKEKKNYRDRMRLYVSGTQIEDFIKHLPKLNKILKPKKVRNTAQRNQFIDENFIYSRVKGVRKRLFVGKVYDLAIEDDECYVTEFKVHNSPPGYLGHRETQPLLTQQKLSAVTSESSNLSLILFDEIEKAAPSMQRILLNVFDKALLKLGDNSSVNFERSVIFMTSNLGAREVQAFLKGEFKFFREAEDKLIIPQTSTISTKAAAKYFSPEFINRIDEIISFNTLTKEDFESILELELKKFQDHIWFRLDDKGFNLLLNNDAKNLLLEKGFSKLYGARELKRTILRLLTQPLACFIEDHQNKEVIKVSRTGEKLSFS